MCVYFHYYLQLPVLNWWFFFQQCSWCWTLTQSVVCCVRTFVYVASSCESKEEEERKKQQSLTSCRQQRRTSVHRAEQQPIFTGSQTKAVGRRTMTIWDGAQTQGPDLRGRTSIVRRARKWRVKSPRHPTRSLSLLRTHRDGGEGRSIRGDEYHTAVEVKPWRTKSGCWKDEAVEQRRMWTEVWIKKNGDKKKEKKKKYPSINGTEVQFRSSFIQLFFYQFHLFIILSFVSYFTHWK